MSTNELSMKPNTVHDPRHQYIDPERATHGFRALVQDEQDDQDGEHLSDVIRAIAQHPANEHTPPEMKNESRKVILTPQDLSRLQRLVHLVMVTTSEMSLWLANAGNDFDEHAHK